MTGKFITIYGINNIGKTTHARRLVKKLEKEGVKAVYVKYPVYDIKPTGPYINRLLRSRGTQKITEEELQMWFALNRYQFQPQLMKYLSEGIWVVAEDYTGTGLAWGAAKGAKLAWLEEIHKYLKKEDFSIMMEGQRVILARENVHIHESDDLLVRKCQKVHGELAKKYGWKTVELQEKPDDTAKLIWKAVRERFGI